MTLQLLWEEYRAEHGDGYGYMANALDEQRRQPDIAALSFEERLALQLDDADLAPVRDLSGLLAVVAAAAG